MTICCIIVAVSYNHCVKSVRIRSYSGPHIPTFRLDMERYSVSLRIQSEWGKMRTTQWIAVNSVMLCKINTCIKKQFFMVIAGSKLEKKTETIDRCSLPHVFLKNTTDKLQLNFVWPYFLWSRLVLDSCWFVLTRVGLVLLVSDSCLLVSDSCWFVLTRVGLVWFVLTRVDSCWYSCIIIDLIVVIHHLHENSRFVWIFLKIKMLQ